MKKTIIGLLIFIFGFSSSIKADEGMWFLAFLNKNYEQMKAQGFKLTPEDIYSINQASLKDAVLALDHGSCSSELVSPNGLLLTNHHCGYGEIQNHSTVEHDYLTDGFWSKSYKEELANPGKTASRLVRMEDVTARFNEMLHDSLSEKERDAIIRKLSKQIEDEAIANTIYDAQVRSMFSSNEFYLFVYETFKDIRLVAAPPESIGKYGHDTDNWMWPRHTGDFSIFRVYADKDNKPAEYSEDNQPYKPVKFLEISMMGYKDGDFAMVMGFPGTTNRYLTASGVKQTMDNENDIRIKVRGKKLEILKAYMDKSDKARIQYSSKYAQSSNYYKYSIGQNKGLKDLNVIARKKQFEKKLGAWIGSDSIRMQKYGFVLDTLNYAYQNSKELDATINYWFEALYLGPEVFGYSLKGRRLEGLFMQKDEEGIKTFTEEWIADLNDFYKDYDINIDKDLFVELVKLYKNSVGKDFQLASANEDKAIEELANSIYTKSIFTDRARLETFLKEPKLDVLKNDPAYIFMNEALMVYFGIQGAMDPVNDVMGLGYRKFMASWLEMEKEENPDKLYYPDANSTIRLTYGNVGGYTANGKNFDYTTDLDGYMAKADPNNKEFMVSKRMKKLYRKKKFGQYANADGKLTVCFLTNNDITGGNSGSPVMNGNGQLIGIAFDGNWEAMSGDIAFEPELQKTINVDIRFVLWVIDVYAGSDRLIDEMVLAKN